jgi:hypothetical protein
MKRYYLTDESEKSLAPFFSERVLAALMFSVVVVGVFLMVFWPRRPLSDVIVTHQGSTVFFLIAAVTLILHSYINLCCGAGDMVRKGYHRMHYQTDKPTYEKEIDFYRYGLIEFLWHALILLLPFVPFLSLAAFISSASLLAFIMAVCVLYTTSLLCRLSGFFVYLTRGRSSTLGYFAARSMMIFFVFITLIFAPAVNPLHFLYRLNQGAGGMGGLFAVYLAVVMPAILVLIRVNGALVRRHINKEEKNRSEGDIT